MRHWVVTAKPSDYPDSYVARLWTLDMWNGLQPQPTEIIIVEPDLEAVRAKLRAKGLTPFIRSVGDDPVIVETWL